MIARQMLLVEVLGLLWSLLQPPIGTQASRTRTRQIAVSDGLLAGCWMTQGEFHQYHTPFRVAEAHWRCGSNYCLAHGDHLKP